MSAGASVDHTEARNSDADFETGPRERPDML
jgi:hypothetical protein